MSHTSNATEVERNTVEKGDKTESLKRTSSELNDKEETKTKLQKLKTLKVALKTYKEETEKEHQRGPPVNPVSRGPWWRSMAQNDEKENGAKHKEEEDDDDSKDEDEDEVGAEGEGDDFDEEEGDEDVNDEEEGDDDDEEA